MMYGQLDGGVRATILRLIFLWPYTGMVASGVLLPRPIIYRTWIIRPLTLRPSPAATYGLWGKSKPRVQVITTIGQCIGTAMPGAMYRSLTLVRRTTIYLEY